VCIDPPRVLRFGFQKQLNYASRLFSATPLAEARPTRAAGRTGPA
jgi:hypothetical protein